MFASEVAIARSLASAGLSWVLGVALVLMVVAFAAVAGNAQRILLGVPSAGAPRIAVPATVAAAVTTGVIASVALGATAGPLAGLFNAAAGQFGAG
ncbi:hypothetical protein NIIDMKKI_52410 [Mycobacterium kansasii]|nr:hypothetical protein NIIDMKKI_52410 [Mycobacterium kansasii]